MYQRIHCKPSWCIQQFFLKPKKKCSCQFKKILQHIVQTGCPAQMNGINCRLFAVMNCLHILMVLQSIL